MNRKEGKVPCVIYGGKEQVHFVMEEKPFSKILFTPDVYLVHLHISGKEYKAVLQDVQYHPVSDRVLHADFLEVLPDKPITVALPVRIEGNSVGVMKGGKLVKKMRKVRVRGMSDDLPSEILISIDKLDIGGSIRIRDIKEEKLSFLDTPSAVVVTVKTSRVAAAGEMTEEESEAAEGAAEEKAEGAE